MDPMASCLRLPLATDGLKPPDAPAIPPLDLGLRIAERELTDLLGQLEPGLTDRQRALVHRLRLTAESVGAARATLVGRLR